MWGNMELKEEGEAKNVVNSGMNFSKKKLLIFKNSLLGALL